MFADARAENVMKVNQMTKKLEDGGPHHYVDERQRLKHRKMREMITEVLKVQVIQSRF